MAPPDFLKLGRLQLRPYAVTFVKSEARAIKSATIGYEVRLANGKRVRGRKILLATGLRDDLPPIKGIDRFYGHSVFHCPYCDGWENRDAAIVVYGKGHRGFGLSISMLGWSANVVLCSDGPSGLNTKQRAGLKRAGIPLREEAIQELKGRGALLHSLRFKSGEEIPCSAFFFNTGCFQGSPLGRQSGCRFDGEGAVKVRKYQIVGKPGIYAAGNILRDVQLSIVAAAEGAAAAFEINCALLKADRNQAKD